MQALLSVESVKGEFQKESWMSEKPSKPIKETEEEN